MGRKIFSSRSKNGLCRNLSKNTFGRSTASRDALWRLTVLLQNETKLASKSHTRTHSYEASFPPQGPPIGPLPQCPFLKAEKPFPLGTLRKDHPRRPSLGAPMGPRGRQSGWSQRYHGFTHSKRRQGNWPARTWGSKAVPASTWARNSFTRLQASSGRILEKTSSGP